MAEENNYFLFGVRNYDKETGRFLQVDPLWEKFANYNPYHYCYNNPISFKDPTGFAPEKEDNELQGKEKRDERLQKDEGFERLKSPCEFIAIR